MPVNCKICGKSVTLVPSTAHRAKTDISGHPASYFTSLFPNHAACEVNKRSQAAIDLMKKIRSERTGTLHDNSSN